MYDHIKQNTCKKYTLSKNYNIYVPAYPNPSIPKPVHILDFAPFLHHQSPFPPEIYPAPTGLPPLQCLLSPAFASH